MLSRPIYHLPRCIWSVLLGRFSCHSISGLIFYLVDLSSSAPADTDDQSSVWKSSSKTAAQYSVSPGGTLNVDTEQGRAGQQPLTTCGSTPLHSNPPGTSLTQSNPHTSPPRLRRWAASAEQHWPMLGDTRQAVTLTNNTSSAQWCFILIMMTSTLSLCSLWRFFLIVLIVAGNEMKEW